jgi:hypothetical protein
MVRKNAADFLSPEARKAAGTERNYLCYEEDAAASIVIRELLDKNMWQIPDRISNKPQYEDNINESLQSRNPEYWEGRQQRLAPQAEPPAAAPGKPLAQPKPSTLAGRLEAGKAKAEAHNAERKTSAAPRRTKADAVV